MLDKLDILVDAGGLADHEHWLCEAVAHSSENGRALAAILDMVVVGIVPMGPGSLLRRLNVESGFVQVTDGPPACNQITQLVRKELPLRVELWPVQLRVPVPHLRRQEAHFVVLIESLELRPADLLSPQPTDDLGSLCDRVRGPVLEKRLT